MTKEIYDKDTICYTTGTGDSKTYNFESDDKNESIRKYISYHIG